MNVTIVDPKVDEKEVKQKTGLSSLSSIPSHKKFTIIILLCIMMNLKYLQR